MIARHGTLTGSSTVDTITVTGIDPSVSRVLVILRASGVAYFTVATNGTTAATPTVAGNDTYVVADPELTAYPVEVGRATSLSIKIVSADALAYSIVAE